MQTGVIVDRSPEDLREVGNYVVALEHGMSRLKKLPPLRQAYPGVARKTHDGRPWTPSSRPGVGALTALVLIIGEAEWFQREPL